MAAFLLRVQNRTTTLIWREGLTAIQLGGAMTCCAPFRQNSTQFRVVRVWSFDGSEGFSKQRAVDGRKSPKLRKLVPQRYVSCARNRAAS